MKMVPTIMNNLTGKREYLSLTVLMRNNIHSKQQPQLQQETDREIVTNG